MRAHHAHGWLSYWSEFPGNNWVFYVGHALKSKTPRYISMEKPTISSLGRSTLQCYMYILCCMNHWSNTLDVECMLMIASIVELFLDALSQKNVKNTSAFADVTQLTMASLARHAHHIPQRYGHGDDPEAVHPCWACRQVGGTPDWSRKYFAIPSRCCPLQVCILPASLPRSDDRPAYTSSEHIEGIQDGHICTSNSSSVQLCLERHAIIEDIQPWCQYQTLHWH